MAGSPEAARLGWARMSPESRAVRLGKLRKSGQLASTETRSSSSKELWERPGFRENQIKTHTGYKRSEESKAKTGSANKGSKRTPEQSANIAAGVKRAWARRTSEEKARILGPAWSAMRGARPSSLERIVRSFLDEQAITYQVDQVIIRYHPDILFSEKMLIVECDGWPHTFEKQQTHDAVRDERLSALGYKIVRFDQQAIQSGAFKELLLRELAL